MKFKVYNRPWMCYGVFYKSGTKKELQKYIGDNRKVFSNLNRDTADLLNVCADMKIKKLEVKEGGKVNMCQGWDEMLQEARETGEENGRTKGRIEMFVVLNLEEGRTKEVILPRMIQKFSLSEKDADTYFAKYSECVV